MCIVLYFGFENGIRKTEQVVSLDARTTYDIIRQVDRARIARHCFLQHCTVSCLMSYIHISIAHLSNFCNTLLKSLLDRTKWRKRFQIVKLLACNIFDYCDKHSDVLIYGRVFTEIRFSCKLVHIVI